MKSAQIIKLRFTSGFTLMELLIVIAILGVLAGLVWTALDPVDKMNGANDAQVQSSVGSIALAEEGYATSRASTANGVRYAISVADLASHGEFKLSTGPNLPSGYNAYAFIVPAGCGVSGGATCTSVVVCGQLKSKKYAIPAGGFKVRIYTSGNNKSCDFNNGTNGCTVSALLTPTTNCP